MAAKEVDWSAYFDSIKESCPWSNIAWAKNKIDIVAWQGRVVDLGDYRARIYTFQTQPRFVLWARMRWLNWRTKDEWLYSHPHNQGLSTPVPCLIQQNALELSQIRSKL